jgi:hypothetical protein
MVIVGETWLWAVKSTAGEGPGDGRVGLCIFYRLVRLFGARSTNGDTGVAIPSHHLRGGLETRENKSG